MTPNHQTPAMSSEVVGDDDVELTRDLAMLARGPGVLIDRELLQAYAAAAVANTLRAFRADVSAFDTWCRVQGVKSLPASPRTLATFL